MSRYSDRSASPNSDKSRMAFNQLQRFAEILRPEDAEEPILAPSVRAALYEWMIEMRNAEALSKVKVKPRSTALLYGPPGTGKTTLSHHIAARFNRPLIAVQSEKIIDKYLGASGQNLGQLFDLLHDVEDTAIVLFDEFDAIGTKRQTDTGGGAQNERNATLTVFLRRIEAFQGIALAATNTKEAIDAAAWRRFGLMICVDLPHPDERFAIIKKYAQPYELDDLEVDRLVDLTERCSPSLLRQLMEGMKRTLVLGPMMNRDISDPVTVFEQIVSSIAPPPELDQPTLWADSYACRKLKGMQWPPKLMAPPKKEEGSGDDHEKAP